MKNKFKISIWQNSRPGNKFPVIARLFRRKWHIVFVGHAWEYWQSAMKEGRELLKLVKEKYEKRK